MADTLSEKERSVRMSKIRSTDTKPEIIVRKYLFSKGFRYSLHKRKLPGNPDLVLKKHGVIIYVNGCFWHGHEDCKTWRIPLSKQEFWVEKITKNRARDLRNLDKIRELGWKPIIVWECEIKNIKLRSERLAKLVKEIGKLSIKKTSIKK
jgi:DNA mismatch endonuclease (patch repair protein)